MEDPLKSLTKEERTLLDELCRAFLNENRILTVSELAERRLLSEGKTHQKLHLIYGKLGIEGEDYELRPKLIVKYCFEPWLREKLNSEFASRLERQQKANQKQVNDLTKRLTAVSQEKDTLQLRLVELEISLAGLSAEKERLNSQIDEAKSQLDQTLQEKEELLFRSDSVLASSAELQAKLNGLEAELAKASQEKELLQENLHKAQADIAETEERNQALLIQFKEASKSMSEGEKEIEALRIRLDAAQMQIADVEVSNRNLEEELEESLNSLEESRIRIEELQNLNDEHQRQVDELRAQVNSLQNRLDEVLNQPIVIERPPPRRLQIPWNAIVFIAVFAVAVFIVWREIRIEAEGPQQLANRPLGTPTSDSILQNTLGAQLISTSTTANTPNPTDTPGPTPTPEPSPTPSTLPIKVDFETLPDPEIVQIIGDPIYSNGMVAAGDADTWFLIGNTGLKNYILTIVFKEPLDVGITIGVRVRDINNMVALRWWDPFAAAWYEVTEGEWKERARAGFHFYGDMVQFTLTVDEEQIICLYRKDNSTFINTKFENGGIAVKLPANTQVKIDYIELSELR